MTLSEWYLKIKDGISSTINKVGAGADSASAKFNTLKNNAAGVEAKLNSAAGSGNKLANVLMSVAAAAGITLGVAAIKNIGNELINTSTKAESLRNSLNLIGGSESAGAKNLEYIKQMADTYGASFDVISEGYKKIAATTRGTKLEGQAAKDLLEGITMASASLGLGGDESAGALLAMSQMISKGKVSMEELSGQLGERLPGALQLAARSMDMTTEKLIKKVSLGNLDPNDFIPKFAQQLKKEFASSSEVASNSLQAIKNRTENTLLYLKQRIAGSLAPYFTSMYEQSGKLLGWISENGSQLLDVFGAVGIGLGILATGFGVVALQAKLSAWFVGKSSVAFILHTLVTEGWAAAQLALNMVLAANPIGVVVMAVAALAAGIYYAYQRSETFRSVVLGVWEVIKGFFSYLWAVIKGFPLAKAITWLIQNFDQVKDAIRSLWNMMKPFFTWVYDAAMKFIQPVVDLFKLMGQGIGWVADKLGITDATVNVKTKFEEGYSKGKKKVEGSESGLNKLVSSGINPLGSNAAGIPGKDKELEKGINSVSGGGKQIRNVTVTIHKFVESLNINSTNVKEGAEELKRMIEEYLLRAVQGSELAMSND